MTFLGVQRWVPRFEEVSPSAWPVDLTFKAFVGTVICTTSSYGLLAIASRIRSAYVVSCPRRTVASASS